MLILCDKKMPSRAKEKLASFGNLVELSTSGITYEAISGHPDIFLCPTPKGLIAAPNLPKEYFEILEGNDILYKTGELPVEKAYPGSARYNALALPFLLIHNTDITDRQISVQYKTNQIVHMQQGYTRCNLIAVSQEKYVTCDHGIEKALQMKKKQVLFVETDLIQLEGFSHGFFGGACGIFAGFWFICGSLKFMKQEVEIRNLASAVNLEIIELYDGPLIDVGTIMAV